MSLTVTYLKCEVIFGVNQYSMTDCTVVYKIGAKTIKAICPSFSKPFLLKINQYLRVYSSNGNRIYLEHLAPAATELIAIEPDQELIDHLQNIISGTEEEGEELELSSKIIARFTLGRWQFFIQL